MAELITGASYPARRVKEMVVQESKNGALMVYIPFALTGGIEYQGSHSVCIGTKDGTLQEMAIQNLRDIFKWETENPWDLQRIPIPDSEEPEFVLADYHNEPYTPNGKTEQVDSFKFRWLNKLGSGVAPATEEEETAGLSKWGKKFSTAPSTPAPAKKKTQAPAPHNSTKPAEKVAPKRTLAAKAPTRVLTAESLLTLIAQKKGIDENDQEAMNTFGNDVYFPLTDKLFGAGNMPETPEQFEQVAKEFGV